MLHDTAHLYGQSLGARDGFIGSIQDLYFDDQTWDVRYLVVNAGTWLAERLVLLAPDAFATPPVGARHGRPEVFRVNRTRAQIENSPPVSAHRPVSRQQLDEFHARHAWPRYWAAGGAWGIASYPVFLPPPGLEPERRQRLTASDDLHLRSTRALTGYSVDAANGALGRLRALLFNDVSWRIENLIVETGHWFSARKLRIPTSNIERISFGDSTVYLKPLNEHLLPLRRSNSVRPAADLHEVGGPGR